jgi:hypothetical protein
MNRSALYVARLANLDHIERLVIVPVLVMFGWSSAVGTSD